MSVSHWWVSFLIDETEYAGFLPPFKTALTAPVPEEGPRGIDLWRADPASFESLAFLRGVKNEHVNDFLWAFNLPGFGEFSKELFFRGGPFSSYLREERLFRFVSIARNPPVAVLWHALGYERARLLPGTMGNLLLAPGDVADAASAVSRAYDGTSAEELLVRGVRFCEADIHSPEQVKNAITHLPELLARASDERKGVLTFARSEL
jgi:hypothetical protein